MLVAEQFPSVEVSDRRRGRRRSRRGRLLRKLRRTWRRARWRRTVVSLILAVGAVIGGYKAAMYVVNQDLPSPEDLKVVPRGK